MDPRDILQNGQQILEAVLVTNGFTFKETQSGKSSGGNFASGKYEKADRRLEIHVRHSLGLVTYHIGPLTISHEAYMRAQLGSQGGNRHPNFSDDPFEALRSLAFDLKTFCSDFLSGPGEDFARCAKIAEEHENRSGFSRMITHEG